MKKIIKENIKLVLVALITGIICISGTVLAENLISANQIGYNNTTVADQLDSLYQTMFSNNYSTGEKRVGKWVDNKPLYQRTIRIENPEFNSNKQSYIYFSDVQIDTPVRVDAYFQYISDGVLRPLETHSKVSGFGLQKNTSPAPNSFYIQGTESGQYSIIVYATVQYTKTTDQPITD